MIKAVELPPMRFNAITHNLKRLNPLIPKLLRPSPIPRPADEMAKLGRGSALVISRALAGKEPLRRVRTGRISPSCRLYVDIAAVNPPGAEKATMTAPAGATQTPVRPPSVRLVVNNDYTFNTDNYSRQ